MFSFRTKAKFHYCEASGTTLYVIVLPRSESVSQ